MAAIELSSNGTNFRGDPMNARQKKKMILLAAAVIALGAAAILAWAVLAPVRVEPGKPNIGKFSSGAKNPVGGAVGENADITDNLALNELQRLCSMNLRRPLYEKKTEPEKPNVVKASSSNASISVELVGTATEPGHSVAFLKTKNGIIELCPAGGSIENDGDMITVTSVEHKKATVKYGGKTYELEVEEEK